MTLHLVTLLTDFGRSDSYVGQMHGVLATIAPAARVIDLTQEIPPQQIAAGAMVLADAVEAFPPGTIHVAVVDPGVGSTRRAIAAEIGDWIFVGPDNGLFSAVLERWECHRAVELTETRFHRAAASVTFHGRDVFAPVAGHLARGVSLAEFGPALVQPLVRLSLPTPRCEAGQYRGEVLWVDHFGNLITNLRREHMVAETGVVSVLGHDRLPMVSCYAHAEVGTLVALFGSSGRLELAVRNGSAAERLGAGVGLPVTVRAS